MISSSRTSYLFHFPTENEKGSWYVRVTRKARRNLTIYVDEKAQVSVSAPIRASLKEIEGFIREKEKWILAKIEEAKAHQRVVAQKDYKPGHSFLFLGKKYRLNVETYPKKRPGVVFDGLSWTVYLPDHLDQSQFRSQIRSQLIKWYRAQAQEILGGRIYHFARIMKAEPQKIAIRSQKRLWGCCDYNTRTIHLNWQIILAPVRVIDYIIVHEIAHLTHPNHSKRFWAKVEKFFPDFKAQKAWLKDNAAEMTLPN